MRLGYAPAALALAAVVACGTFSSTPPETNGGSDAGLDAPSVSPDGAAPLPDAGPQLPVPKPCGTADVFCDDFEAPDAVNLPGKWDSVYRQSLLDVTTGQGAAGSVGLRAQLEGADAGDLQQGFLRKNRPGAAPARYTTIIAFNANVTLNNGSVDGPKLRTDLSAGGQELRDVSVRWSDMGRRVEIDYVADKCNACGLAPPDVVTITPGWHAYALVVSVDKADPTNRTYGRLTLFVDGAVAIDAPLGLDMGGAAERALLFGVSRASSPVKGTLLLDDLYLEVVDAPP
ncbi:MAG: hypothetical protein KC657_38640 [Myxococcales bacterium]|nr:hypothetical protein [Myxococcales bacterium]